MTRVGKHTALTCRVKVRAVASIIAAELEVADADEAWRRAIRAHLAVAQIHDATCPGRLPR